MRRCLNESRHLRKTQTQKKTICTSFEIRHRVIAFTKAANNKYTEFEVQLRDMVSSNKTNYHSSSKKNQFFLVCANIWICHGVMETRKLQKNKKHSVQHTDWDYVWLIQATHPSLLATIGFCNLISSYTEFYIWFTILMFGKKRTFYLTQSSCVFKRRKRIYNIPNSTQSHGVFETRKSKKNTLYSVLNSVLLRSLCLVIMPLLKRPQCPPLTSKMFVMR